MNGSTKLAVPTWTADAPRDHEFESVLSFGDFHLRIGIFTTSRHSHTIRNGDRSNRRPTQSTNDVRDFRPSGFDVDDHGRKVLTSDTASAPAS